MKFLCIACDEAMKLVRTEGPDAGSMSVVFACPACGWETAMLTNSMETQMVRSLGVKIGGRQVPAEPMEMVRSSLADVREAGPGTDAAPSDGREATPANDAAPAVHVDATGESKCPFSGMVEEAFAKHGAAEITWTPEAEERIGRIPAFAQPMVRKGLEMHARERGYTEINDTVIEEVKDRFGM